MGDVGLELCSSFIAAVIESCFFNSITGDYYDGRHSFKIERIRPGGGKMVEIRDAITESFRRRRRTRRRSACSSKTRRIIGSYGYYVIQQNCGYNDASSVRWD